MTNLKNIEIQLTKINFYYLLEAIFGNVSGLKWYIDRIVNNIELKTYVIGKNLKSKKLARNPKIIFKGFVKNLNQFIKMHYL